MASAISAGRMSRRNCVYGKTCLLMNSSPSARTIGVSVKPGWMTQQRTPWKSAGSASRETRMESWRKSLLEAVQGRHYVRYLKDRLRQEGRHIEMPASFADHAVYYSLYPERLAETVLGRAVPSGLDPYVEHVENVASLVERLGPDRPVLFRNLTPPGIAMCIAPVETGICLRESCSERGEAEPTAATDRGRHVGFPRR
jgi:hypothetical protein